jgi:hypothetical protein
MRLSYPAELLMLSPDWDTRGSLRHPVRLFGSKLDGVTALKVIVTDLSTTGCRIQGTGALPAGDEVWLRLSGLGVHRASIVWSGDDGDAGLSFGTPISASGVAAAVGHSPARPHGTRPATAPSR